MKKLTIIFIISLFSSLLYANELKELYFKNNGVFWTKWNKEKESFKSCKPNIFLKNSFAMSGNSEVSETIYEAIEKTIIEKPICVLNSINTLSEKEQKHILNIFVARPLYHNINEIEKSLKTVWDKKEYEKSKTEFLRLKKEIWGK